MNDVQAHTRTHALAHACARERTRSVWDMNEVVRLQLFEMRVGEHVRLMGEFKTTHKDIIAQFADGIQQVRKPARAHAWQEDRYSNGASCCRCKSKFK